ncbi:hypothetical protein C356_00248 [Cryptococcus neoformans c45]|nr:hypothetical protein C356_00248 [Cryptococcus neoformans var. grubii c45]
MNSQNQQPPLNLSDPQLQARLALLAAQQQNLQDRQPVSQDHIAAMAAAVGSMQGQNREAIMKQLQALQNSQAHRAKLVAQQTVSQQPQPGPSAPSPANQQGVSAPSPITAPSPSNPLHQDSFQHPGMPRSGSGDNPLNQQQQQQQQQQQTQPLMSQQQRELFLAQQRAHQQQSMAGSSDGSVRPPLQAQPNLPGQPQGQSPRQPLSHVQQRQNFLKTFLGYFQNTGQQPPPAIFDNGEREGAFKVGDGWMDVIDLLMAVMKAGGILNAMQQPADSPAWRNLLAAKNIPTTLPYPIPAPKPPNSDPNAPPTMTTDPVQYLAAAYFAYIHGFETHMQKTRQASYARQQAMAIAQGRPPPPPPVMPSLAGFRLPGQAPSPADSWSSAQAQTPAPAAPPLPPPLNTSAQPPPTSTVPTPTHPAPSPSDSSTKSSTTSGPLRARKTSSKKEKKDLSVNTNVPSPVDGEAETPTGSSGGKKRKRKNANPSQPETASTPAPPPTVSTPAPEPPTEPTKRARYRVEYRPINFPVQTFAGWEPSMVSSTFAKHSLRQGTRPIHDLAVVDMEAILMGLRSRMPKELGYAVTVLNMLSMSHPEENINGLPLHHLREIFIELLDLTEEAAFGDEGWSGWLKNWHDLNDVKEESALATDDKNSCMDNLNKMPFSELERLGRDFDFSIYQDDEEYQWRKEETCGNTEIVLACINMLRNFSMLPDNQELMASYPQMINLLASISDARLCRLPGESRTKIKRPFSILELARIRRDCVSILVNIGEYVELPRVPSSSSLAIFRLLSTFIASGWESNALSEPIYGPTLSSSVRDVGPPTIVPSIDRALAAFSLLAQPDANREALGSSVPPSELIDLYQSLLKLLPVTKRQFEAMHTIEETLGYNETLALCLYSLAFLSPLHVRANMRNVPGSVPLLTRIIFDTALQKSDYRSNPFGILCRRLCETLGVLNGTVSPAGTFEGPSGMGFGAGGIEGSGWKFASGRVENGWLAGKEEGVLGAILGVKGMSWAALGELDGMVWGDDSI